MSQREQPSRIAVLLFTDIVGSVALEKRLGTEAYLRVLELHHQLFQQALEAVGTGEILKRIGDGFLSEFATATDAVNTALLFQMLLRETRWEYEGPKVRIGLHQGLISSVPGSHGEIAGIPVSIASRVMDLALGGQILITRPVYEDARQFVRKHPVAVLPSPKLPRVRWKAHGYYLAKGADEPIEVFEVGAAGIAPFITPPDSEKAHRVLPGASRPRQMLIGAAVTVLCGLALWTMPAFDAWENASYDYLFRFGGKAITNKVVLVQIDEPSLSALGQTRGNWNRDLHTKFLNKLAEAGNPLVVFDIFFEKERNTQSDAALAAAMRRHGHVVLGAKMSDSKHPILNIAEAVPLQKVFIEAATNWGLGRAGANKTAGGAIEEASSGQRHLEFVRQHYPFPAPSTEEFPSLPWVAAKLAGAKLNDTPQKQWLRYYGPSGAWETFSYHMALSNSPAYFKDKVVFIGSKPANSDLSYEDDKFCTPYSRWSHEGVGGMEILATTFLNLMNGDWLRRAPWWGEALLIIASGALLGGGVCWLRPLWGTAVAIGAAFAGGFAGIYLSYVSNYWFPWLVVAGGQVPAAWIWSVVARRIWSTPDVRFFSSIQPAAEGTEAPVPAAAPVVASALPDTTDYELIDPPFGEGGFGKVWLAKNAIGQWQALKAVYQEKFGKDTAPYEAEFKGIKRYKPVSDKHPGLLRVDFVSKKKDEGYFYYVMELGDAQEPGWERNPASYKPRDLANVRAKAKDGRLPVSECLSIGLVLSEALEFLHSQGLTHRDIKPPNIIFVNGRPKLTDIGLVTEMRPPNQVTSYAGTEGYMPPPPEPPGTAQADVYALGMVLYVMSTGRAPGLFPELVTVLMQGSQQADFMRFNAIIVKACHPDRAERYQSAKELREALRGF